MEIKQRAELGGSDVRRDKTRGLKRRESKMGFGVPCSIVASFSLLLLVRGTAEHCNLRGRVRAGCWLL